MWLRMDTPKQLAKHVIVGFSGAVINVSIMYLMTDLLGSHYLFSAIIAFLVSTLNSFMLNKIWTYKHHQGCYKKQVFRYLLTSSFGLAINLVLLPILVEYFDLWYLMAQTVTIIQLGLFSFFINKYWIFCPIIEENSKCHKNKSVKSKFRRSRSKRRKLKQKKKWN